MYIYMYIICIYIYINIAIPRLRNDVVLDLICVMIGTKHRRDLPSPVVDWAEVPVRLNKFFSMDVTEPTRLSELATL